MTVTLRALEKRHYADTRTVPLHSHDFHEIVYYTDGQGQTNIDRVCHTFESATFAVIPPHAAHDENHDRPCRLFCVQFYTDCDIPCGVYRDDSQKIRAVLDQLHSEIVQQEYGYRDMIDAKVKELLLLVCRPARPHARSGGKDLAYSINYICSNYHEKIVFRDLARHMHLSYDYFRHVFFRQTGRSPQQFLIEQRLTHARGLLDEGEKNCTEIAFLCGFSTSAQFSTLFKRAYGMSPLQYKKQSARP